MASSKHKGRETVNRKRKTSSATVIEDSRQSKKKSRIPKSAKAVDIIVLDDDSPGIPKKLSKSGNVNWHISAMSSTRSLTLESKAKGRESISSKHEEDTSKNKGRSKGLNQSKARVENLSANKDSISKAKSPPSGLPLVKAAGFFVRSYALDVMHFFRKYPQQILESKFGILALDDFNDKEKWFNKGNKFVGENPVVYIGDELHHKLELCILGLHLEKQRSIDFFYNGKCTIATSLVDTKGYSHADILIYSGQCIKSKDQNGNHSLMKCIVLKSPVRVIRRRTRGEGEDRRITYIYDGLYLVERYWYEEGIKFLLRRIPGQPELPSKILKELQLSSLDTTGIKIRDISDGMEITPVGVVNEMGDESPEPFTYTNKVIYSSRWNPQLCEGCDCVDGCSDSEICSCAVKNGGELPFNCYRKLINHKESIVYECGPLCKCPPTCRNRVSQFGMNIHLQVFKTESRGWGVRTESFIPSGGFVCEYTGELLSESQAEDCKEFDEYLFDIGGDSNEQQSSADDGYVIDAFRIGGVSRFINHSCSPNLFTQHVLFDHDDEALPHIMLFASTNIQKHQELSYHYNYKIDTVSDSDGKIKQKECYCGSQECEGRLY